MQHYWLISNKFIIDSGSPVIQERLTNPGVFIQRYNYNQTTQDHL